jgi:hypothetical protein
MSNDKPGGTDDVNNDQKASIKISDLPVEAGSDGKADQVKGGGYELKNVMVTSVQPGRP